jgi:hypothetical protein
VGWLVCVDYFQKEVRQKDENEGLLLFAALVIEVHDDGLQGKI